MPTERPFWIWQIDRWHLLVAILLVLTTILAAVAGPGQRPQDVAVAPTVEATPAPAPAEVAPGFTQPGPDQSVDSPQPLLQGVATPNSVVRIYDGDSKLGETVADAGGAWRFQPPNPLSPGDHRLVVVGLDSNGNEVFPSPPLLVSVPGEAAEPTPGTPGPVEVTSPTAVIGETPTATFAELPVTTPTSPEADQETATASPTLAPADMATPTPTPEVEAVPTTAEEGLETATASPTLAPADMATPTPTPEVGAVPTTAEEGLETATASPTLAPAGIATATPGVEVETRVTPSEATAAPVVKPLTTATPVQLPGPIAPSLVRPPSGVLGNSRPTLSGVTAPYALISIYDGETLLGEAMADAQGRWHFLPDTPLAAGQHTLEFKAIDNKGSLVTFASIDIEIARDAEPIEPPSVEVIPAGAEPAVTAALEGRAEPGQLVYILDGKRLLNVVRATRDGSWRLQLPRGLPAGLHEFRVAIKGADGSVLSESQAVDVSVDLPAGMPETGAYRADLDPKLQTTR